MGGARPAFTSPLLLLELLQECGVRFSRINGKGTNILERGQLAMLSGGCCSGGLSFRVLRGLGYI